MRALRLVMVGLAGGAVVACGMIAGVDSYSSDTDPDASRQVDATTVVTPELDSSQGRVDSGTTNLDATTITEPDTSFDAYTPPPPPLGDGCPGTGENGQGCTSANTCCSTVCTEQRKCEGSCKKFNDGCNQGECCIGFYCPLDFGGNTCADCINKGGQPPVDSNFHPYNEACCSGSSHLSFTLPPYPICD